MDNGDICSSRFAGRESLEVEVGGTWREASAIGTGQTRVPRGLGDTGEGGSELPTAL